MAELKQIVARNLSRLRKQNHLTQIQLAELIHYSDKAVSKWERGESLPDLLVLKQLADYYHVTLDDLVKDPMNEPVMSMEETMQQDQHASVKEQKAAARNRLIIAGMAGVLVWLIATILFVILDIFVPDLKYSPYMFIYAIPLTAIVWLVFNSVWFNRRRNYLIISILVWTTLGVLYISFYEYNFWPVFIIGIPAQIIILLWSKLRPKKAAIKQSE
ncbi:MAG: helix-turn-helix transcriptional regulator [Oscillospiraceae bacterium]|nr:helix-turn-helix transcriptional regulator [Oscillospiraceae bacterium]